MWRSSKNTKFFLRDYDTYRLLYQKKRYDCLLDLGAILTDQGIMNLDEKVLWVLEKKACVKGNKIDTCALHFEIEYGIHMMIRHAFREFPGRDLIIILSGKVDWDMFEKYLEEVNLNNVGETDVYLCMINRDDQDQFFMTCLAY